MTQNTWTYRNFNRLPRGPNKNGFVERKYECDQYNMIGYVRGEPWGMDAYGNLMEVVKMTIFS